MRNNLRIAPVVTLLVIGSALVLQTMGQRAPGPGTRPLRIIEYDGDMAAILAKLPDVFDVTMGLEVDPQEPNSRVVFSLHDPSFPDVMNAIVHSAPRYQWREANGFVDVLPVGVSNRLLDATIINFQVTNVDQSEAVNRLITLPEVQAYMGVKGIYQLPAPTQRDLGSASTATNDKKFSISLERVTMRQALSQIAKAGGGKFWIFRTFSDGSCSISNSPPR